MTILAILATFNFCNLQFWQLSILKLSVLTIFNLGYFQAIFLNGSQQQEEQEQHINKLYGSCDQKKPGHWIPHFIRRFAFVLSYGPYK